MAQTPAITDEPLWSRSYIKSSTSPVDINYFSNIIGGADPNNSTVALTKADTNMQRSYQLSEPESFTVRAIRLIFDFNSPETDMVTVLNTSWIEFQVAGNSVLAWQGPSKLLTAGCGLPFTVGNATTGQNGYPAPAAVYTLRRPIEIFINETFRVQERFSAVPTLSNNMKSTIVLEGDHYMVEVTGRRSLPR